jgi:hypothetical protein
MPVGQKSYVGDIGTVITVDAGVSIDDATVFKLMIQKPGSTTETEWVAALYGTNYLRYTTVDGDFSVAGTYKLQSFVDTPDGEWRGETTTFRVYGDFK